MAKDIKPSNVEPRANMESDRANRINSLHRSVDTAVKTQNKKTLQISSEVSALTKEQQKMMKQLEIENLKFTNETAEAYNGVVKNLGQTIKNLSAGVKNITVDTAKATAGAIGQYGKAIGEDISLNKKNTIAMSLSRATPLLGYFAAKAVETEAFQNISRKMGEKISSVGSSVLNKFRRKNKVSQDEDDEYGDYIPKMRKGGLVKKRGIVEVHAAEIITPVDKVLDKIKNAKAEDNTYKLNATLSTMSQSVIRMEEVVNKGEETKQDIISTFIDEYTKVANSKETRSWQDRMIDSIEELKVAMIGTSDRLSIAYQQTLLKHPSFRAMIMFGQTMKSVVSAPFKALFSLRGGLAGDVSKATRTSNVYQQQVNMLALIYTKTIGHLRDITKYTKVTAEILAGGPVKPTSDKTYTLFGQIKGFMTKKPEGGEGKKKTLFEKFSEALDLDQDALSEAGLTSFSDLLTPKKLLQNMGITFENIEEKFPWIKEAHDAPGKVSDFASNAAFDAEFAARAKAKSLAHKAKGMYKDTEGMRENISSGISNAAFDAEFKTKGFAKSLGSRFRAAKEFDYKEKAKETFENVKTFPGRMIKELSRIRTAEEDREEREGPHSPSMADNIASTAKTTLKSFKDNLKIEKKKEFLLGKIKDFGKEHSDKLDKAHEKGRKFTDFIKGTVIPVALVWFKRFFRIFSTIGKGILNIVSFLGRFGLKGFMKLGKGLGKTGGNILKGGYGAAKAGGARGLLGWGVKGAATVAGTAAAGTAGALVGGFMTMADMVQAVVSPGDFAGGILVRAFSAALGGAGEAGKGGAKGAKHGALKGAALGSAIGAFGGPIGLAIGGAIGAIAGGILGFVGGENISKVVSAALSGIGKLIKGIWNVAIFPFKLLKEGLKSFWVVHKYIRKKLFGYIDSFLSGPGFVGKMWEKVKAFGSMVSDFFGMLFDPKQLKEGIKSAFATIMTPINYLVTLFKDIGAWIDDSLSNTPIIGPIYKGLKKFAKGTKQFVKDVHEGTLADKLEASLEENDKKSIEAKAKAGAPKKRLTEYEKQMEFERKLKAGEFGDPGNTYAEMNKGFAGSLTSEQIRKKKEYIREMSERAGGLSPQEAFKRWKEQNPNADPSEFKYTHRATFKEGKMVSSSDSLRENSGLRVPADDEVRKAINGQSNLDVVQTNLNMAMLESLNKINTTLEKSSEDSATSGIVSSNSIMSRISNALTKNTVVNNNGGGGRNPTFSTAQNRANTVALANIN